MYASAQKHDFPASEMFRFCGRTGGVVILAIWLIMVVVDLFLTGAPVIENYYQAALLGIVFIGYAAGWRDGLVGGALAIVGTAAFSVLDRVRCGGDPAPGVEWFAAPGACYLLAHYLDKHRNHIASSQS
jgi:hypothetical protein